MTSQNIAGNSSRLSLENCYTNIFALTDLAGIRWRRLRSQMGSNINVLDDPVLSSYAKCLKADMLCSWARVPITDGTPPPDNFMGYAKELWVFWYGDEPTSLQTHLAAELQESEQGSWETTLLSYECRTFLFKALHNVIERCLLAKNFLRIGKWFVQPHDGSDTDTKCSPLSFSFENFFLHGESTVCVSVNVERRNQLYRLSSQLLKQARDGQNSASTGTASARHCNQVILAPYGLAGVLTGRSVSPSEQSVADWQQFYPLSGSVLSADSDLPSTVEVAVGGVRMKYPSAFVVTTQPPVPKENRPKSVPVERCDRCMGVLVSKTTFDSLEAGKRDDESSYFNFTDVHNRVSCNCAKAKSSKKSQRQGSPLSPKLDGRKPRTPFHRRNAPMEKLFPLTKGLKTSLSSSAPVAASSARPSNSAATPDYMQASTPQMTLKDVLSSPTSFPQPSPIRAPRTPKTPAGTLPTDKHMNTRPPSVKASLSMEEQSQSAKALASQNLMNPFSVGGSNQPQTPLPPQTTSQSKDSSVPEVNTPASYIGSQIERLQMSQLSSTPTDFTKRPRLPGSPGEDDELTTNSLYTFAGFQAWLDFPLKKRFKQESISNMTQPRSYEELSHPLTKVSEDTRVTETYYLSNPQADSSSTQVLLVAPESSEPVTSNLLTSASLMPLPSDLDNIFDSEDESSDDRANAAQSGASGFAPSVPHPSSAASSGGMSMASAQAVGPVSAADLSQIYPTPPSHDNHNTALSPADHHQHGQQESADTVDIPEPTAAIYRTSNVAKYLPVPQYQPLELPSTQHPISVPADCPYTSWTNKPTAQPLLMPLNSVENLPLTLSNIQPASVRSVMSPSSAGGFYPPGRTPLGLGPLEMLQSPASAFSMPPKSAAGLSSVENPSTHGAASAFNAQSLPEAQSLLVNMTISDSMLNLYKDQNFDSCNLCVCNMNILGNDLGLYLPREKYEAQYKCSCGFSAVTNRYYGYCSGLFYEDECEIVSHRDDRFDKLKLRPLAESSPQEVNKVILNQLKEQFLSCAPSLLTRYAAFSRSAVSNSTKKLEFDHQDVCAVIMAALNTGQYIQDTMNLSRHQSQSQCWSRWSLERSSKEPLPSTEIMQLLRSLQPALQDAVQKKRTTSLWDPNAIKVTGPMTWLSFFKLAGRNSDELKEPQPVPPFLVGNEDDWLRQSPFSLQHWDKLSLKPYGGQRNISYVVITPDNDLITSASKSFFTELTHIYSQCQLGKHMPYQGLRDGIIRVNKHLASSVGDKPTSDWFNKLDSLPIAQKMKLIARVCKHYLAPLLCNKAPDITSPPPPSAAAYSSAHEGVFTKPSQPGPSAPVSNPHSGVFSPPSRDETNKDILTDPRYKDCRPRTRDNTHTNVVVYLINPCANSTGSKNGAEAEESASTLALFMCFQELLDSLPESMRKQTYLEIVPLHSVLSNNHHSSDQQVMRSMAFSVYSKIARKCSYDILGNTMTGFGPAADNSPLVASNNPSYISLPPYILAPSTDHTNNEGGLMESNSRVLFCAYCLSEDQRWLLGSTTRDNGELMDTTVINIHVPNHSRRKKSTVIKHAIQKLFEYLVVCMSNSLVKWRLVIGRFGRLGHGELKEWSKLLSKKSLMRTCTRLREGCKTCTSVPADMQLGILGACLISIEPHASFSILHTDTSTNKEEKKSSSSPLSTPQDASVTHILVIPNSTTAGGNHNQNEAQIDFSGDMPGDTDGILGDLGVGEDIDFDGLFGIVSNSIDGMSPPHSPTNSSSIFNQAGGIQSRRGTVTSMMDTSMEDQINLLQQPLALGYIISTAPTGKLPSWFHSTAPQTENICPTVLKSALHFHTVCSQQNLEDYNQMTTPNNQKSYTHPLDSTMTCDVLRFVLDSYNRLSWLTVDPATNDRRSCLPVHIDALMKLYHAINTFL